MKTNMKNHEQTLKNIEKNMGNNRDTVEKHRKTYGLASVCGGHRRKTQENI